jgi:hypothetical protein
MSHAGHLIQTVTVIEFAPDPHGPAFGPENPHTDFLHQQYLLVAPSQMFIDWNWTPQGQGPEPPHIGQFFITDTDTLTKPVNCVLAGDERNFKKGQAPSAEVLKKIFGE